MYRDVLGSCHDAPADTEHAPGTLERGRLGGTVESHRATVASRRERGFLPVAPFYCLLTT